MNWLDLLQDVLFWPSLIGHFVCGLKGLHRESRWFALGVAVSFVLVAYEDLSQDDWSAYAFDVAVAAWYFWMWWKSGGDDDFKKSKKKLTEKVTALANGRLGVQST